MDFTIILNNDTQHGFLVTECVYDYIHSRITLRNQHTDQWTSNVIEYLTDLANQHTTITSIVIKSGDDVMRTYENIDATITSVGEAFAGNQDYERIALLTIEIALS